MTNDPIEDGVASTDGDDFTVEGVIDQVSRLKPRTLIAFTFDAEGGMEFTSSGATREQWAFASVFAARNATADFPD
jgi:hypothetical protein